MPQRRYRNNLSNYSAYSNIGTVGFNPVTFNPVTFEPKENDMTLLAQGMARDEARRGNAFTTYETLNKTLADYGKKFSDDPETKAWFDANNKRITDVVNQSIQAGDWERAMLDSQKLASEFVNSREFQDRQRSWEKYNEKLTQVDAMLKNNQIDQDTYDWWVKNNKYKFNPETGSYTDIDMPVASISWPEFTYQALKFITPDVKNVTRGRTFNRTEPGNTTQDASNPKGIATKGGGYQSTISKQKVTKEEIRTQLDNIMKTIPSGARRLNQDYEVRKDVEATIW